MSNRFTWDEAKAYLRQKLGREPTEKEIEEYYNYMSGD